MTKRATPRPFVAKVDIRDGELRRMWAAGYTLDTMGARFGCHAQTVTRRAEIIGLPPRLPGWHRAGYKRTEERQAAATAPDPVTLRKDYPDMLAAIARARVARLPIWAMDCVAARFRLPRAVVEGLGR